MTSPIDTIKIYNNCKELVKMWGGEKDWNEKNELYKRYIKEISEKE